MTRKSYVFMPAMSNSTPPDTEYLFVYGTLAPGECNEHIMHPLKGEWRKASVRGQRSDDGWGLTGGAPGMRFEVDADADAALVDGLLFSSDQLSAHWPRIDEFEGEEYQRITVRVTLEDGEQLDAQVYAVRAFCSDA
ncbi:MAG: gamma-glutamylcyclotransferase family protein [Gammaproteobacteria bacterium]